MALAVILSFASEPVVKSVTAATDSWENNAVAVSAFIFLIVSAFCFSNNIVHKIFCALLMYFNYMFVGEAAVGLMSISLMPQGDVYPLISANLIYVFFTVIIIILLVNPFKYFYRREVSYTSVICSLSVVTGIILASGAFNEFFKIESVALKFYPALIIYLILIFVMNASYSAAVYRIKDEKQLHESEIDMLFADNFDVMLCSAENAEQHRARREKELLGIRKLLENEDKEKVYDYVTMLLKKLKKQKNKFDYCNNPYISSIIACKADVAANEKIFIDGNIEINDTEIEIHELCMIVDELLTALIKDCRSYDDSEKFIRLNGIDTEKKFVLEAVSSFNYTPKTKLFKNTLYDFVKALFEKKERSTDNFARIKKYVSEHSGSLNISTSEGEKITRIEINF